MYSNIRHISVVAKAAVLTVATCLIQTATAAEAVLRVNAGGGAYVDSKGQSWSRDTGFNTGKTFDTNNAIAKTSDDSLYRSERWSRSQDANLQYRFPLDNGNYEVRL